MKQTIIIASVFFVINLIFAYNISISLPAFALLMTVELVALILIQNHYHMKKIKNLKSQNKDLQKENKKITKIITKDTLTNAYSRFAFFEWFKINFPLFNKIDLDLSLIYLDLDYFKNINDKYGHATGDKVLKEISDDIMSHARGKDFLVRLSGDEFVLVCYENQEKTKTIADRIKFRWEKKIWCHGEILSCSMGIAQWKKNESIKSLLERADIALYKAKKDGKNKIVNAA